MSATPKTIADVSTSSPEWFRWVDSVRLGSDWQPVPDDYFVTMIDSIGFVIREDEDQVVIALSVDTDNQMVCGAMAIPKVAIKERWKIVGG